MEAMKSQREIELKSNTEATWNKAHAAYLEQMNKLENFFLREGWRSAMKKLGVAESSDLYS